MPSSPDSPPARSPRHPARLGHTGSPFGVDDLAGRLRALRPSCGPVRLVAVDGHAGSGKSTFATRLADALGGAPVVHLDDLATHADFFGWTDRLDAQVLGPLGRGAGGSYRAYDWVRGEFPSGPGTGTGTAVPVPPAPVVVVEGVGAGRRAVRSRLAALVWMEMAPHQAWARGRRRDGPGLSAFWSAWTRAERTHFAGDPSYSYANFVVRQKPEGHEVRTGPVGTP